MSRTLDLPRCEPESGQVAIVACRRLASALRQIVRNGINAWMVGRTIRTLRSLDDRLLADIGIVRDELETRIRHRARW